MYISLNLCIFSSFFHTYIPMLIGQLIFMVHVRFMIYGFVIRNIFPFSQESACFILLWLCIFKEWGQINLDVALLGFTRAIRTVSRKLEPLVGAKVQGFCQIFT